MFSGILAPETAMPWVDWKWCAEIEPFPCSVISGHRPELPNLGDVNAEDFAERTGQYGPIDLLVAGAPCQDFSVAGQRAGMDGARGNLSLRFVELVRTIRPRWLLFENVPGLLSSASHEAPSAGSPPDDLQPGEERIIEDSYEADEGSDFGYFLSALLELRYSLSYAVLDAQYFGLAQRRDRVFVVGSLGDWRGPSAVLLDLESLSGNPAPSREAGQRVAPTSEGRAGRSGANNFNTSGGLVGPADVNGGGQIAVAFDTTQVTSKTNRSNPQPGDACHSLTSEGHAPAIAFTERGRDKGRTFESQEDIAYALCNPGSGGRTHSRQLFTPMMAVRRLTPLECTRLQGFKDDFFDHVLYRGKPPADGPIYKALGNSMAVPVIAWIGKRIAQVDAILSTLESEVYEAVNGEPCPYQEHANRT
jgi:DNA (cytosine-5)-methyltransferase 1